MLAIALVDLPPHQTRCSGIAILPHRRLPSSRHLSPNPRLRPPGAAASARGPWNRPTDGPRRGATRCRGRFRWTAGENDARKLAAGHSDPATPPKGLFSARGGAFGGNGVEWVKENRDRALAARPHAARVSCAELGWAARTPFHTASMRAMVCSEAHSRSRITQLLRFMRPATCTSSRRLFEARGTLLWAEAQALDRAGDVVAGPNPLRCCPLRCTLPACCK